MNEPLIISINIKLYFKSLKYLNITLLSTKDVAFNKEKFPKLNTF